MNTVLTAYEDLGDKRHNSHGNLEDDRPRLVCYWDRLPSYIAFVLVLRDIREEL